MGYDTSKLDVYIKACELFRMCYERYSGLKEFWLRDQILRSSGSIGANIAEMSGYDSDDMKYHKCSIALGEAAELEFWLTALTHINDPDIISELSSIQKMLFNLRRYYGRTRAQSPESRVRRL